ncbi:MAG: serine protease, partial [Planctomycetota bacterium]|nr:serine protease [Planctomycetota bacterium]
MRILKNPNFIALIAVFCVGLVVGVPKITAYKGKIRNKNQQLNHLAGEIQELKIQHQIQSEQITKANASYKSQRRRENILKPVFQITGDAAVGSAVLLKNSTNNESPHYVALSCYHVVRDILAESGGSKVEAVFEQGREQPLYLEAELISHDANRDLALLRIDTDQDLGKIATLAPRARAKVIDTFSEIYTVGCPLGTPVQATSGEVSREDWSMEDEDYWMISTPAYFGNSGGGVFLAETCELIGIFSKIYTHGSFQPQVITHMGL